jgi:lambda family phage minor tail protein L
MAYAAWVASNPYTVGQLLALLRCKPVAWCFAALLRAPAALHNQRGLRTSAAPLLMVALHGQQSAASTKSCQCWHLMPSSSCSSCSWLRLLHGASTTYYFHAGVNAAVNGNIVFDGDTYVRLPIQAEGFEYSNSGTLPRPTLTVANLGGEISALLLLANAFTPGNDLGGAVVTRIRTLKKYLDGEAAADSHAKFADEIWYIDRKSAETRDVVQWELASKFDLAGTLMPKRQLIANICQWEYRSAECSYTGSNYFDINNNVVGTLAADRCGKRLSSCKLRFGDTNPLPFGSFPGAGLTQ